MRSELIATESLRGVREEEERGETGAAGADAGGGVTVDVLVGVAAAHSLCVRGLQINCNVLRAPLSSQS